MSVPQADQEITDARSLLFVPAGDDRKVGKALLSTADIVVIDLEDAIATPAKDRTRAWLVEFLSAGQATRAPWVRVNAPDSEYGATDLAAIRDLPVAGLVLPKASRRTLQALGGVAFPVLAIIETAHGLRESYEVARHRAVVATMLGAADLGAEFGWQPRPDGLELLFARSTLVLDAAVAGIRPPFDAVCPAIGDRAAVTEEARLARSLGFGGKGCIHPAQLEAVHEAFTPSAEERDAAQRIVTAYRAAADRGEGVTASGGSMIDLPVLARAQAVLARSSSRKDGGVS
jgi:citrate lyase beta subunit